MTRELRAVVAGQTLDGWVMICNACWTTHSDVRAGQRDLPLEEFVAAGWWVGTKRDLCPACVAKAGGLHRVAAAETSGASPKMGRYVPYPESRGTLHCLDCDRTSRWFGFRRGSAAVIDNAEAHDRWHARPENNPAQPAASGGRRCA